MKVRQLLEQLHNLPHNVEVDARLGGADLEIVATAYEPEPPRIILECHVKETLQ